MDLLADSIVVNLSNSEGTVKINIMTRKIILALSLFAAGVFAVSCSVDIPEIEQPKSPAQKYKEVGPEEKDDISKDPVNGIFNYSGMGGHPRLLLRAEDFTRIKTSIAEDAHLAVVHRNILERADYHMGSAPLRYKKIGKRLLDVSRTALERIMYLAYCYKITGARKYLTKAESTINEVCSFSDWNQGEHYLDTGEMALAVAIGLDWLYSDLQPETRQRARDALKSYTFDTFRTDDGKTFRNNMANWNQVCNGGIIAAAIACYEKDKVAMAEIIETCVENNKTHGMTIYNTDGNYPEGYTYWGYGTTYQIIIMAALENVFGHDGGLKESSEGFSKTGLWAIFMEGPSGDCFNYSDAKAAVYPRIPLWYMSNVYEDASLLYKELPKIEKGNYGEYFDERRFVPLVPVFADADLMKRNMTPPEQKIWYGGQTVDTHPTVLVHTDIANPEKDFFLAMKGGRSNTSHAHMDGGSFVFDAYGMRWAMDLGNQTYSQLEADGIDLWNMSQNSTRWKVFRLNNYSHNVVTVNNNIYHYKGGSFIDKTFNTSDPAALGGRYTCYAQNRYGTDMDLKEPAVTRTAELKPVGEEYDLVVTDVLTSCEGKTPDIRWSMTTPAKAEFVSDSCISLSQGGVTMYLTASEASGAALKFFIRDANTEQTFDEYNETVSLVGFEGKMQSAQKWILSTRLSTTKP